VHVVFSQPELLLLFDGVQRMLHAHTFWREETANVM